MNDVFLSVWMITYNHENYLSQALDSVLMQQTTFPIEIIIGEDCSTDKTREILKEYEQNYPEIIHAIYHDVNVGARRNAYEFTLNQCKGKYIACLEGDDYWTDPLKLQKQVDFLETNPEYSICGHRFDFYYQNINQFVEDNNGDLFSKDVKGIDVDTKQFFNRWMLQPLTVVFKREALDIDFIMKIKHLYDFTLFYSILKNGRGYLFNFNGGVYRRHDGGISTSLNPLQHTSAHYEMFKDLYQLEGTELLKEVYLYNTYCHTYTYVKYSPEISLKYIFALIKEQIANGISNKQIVRLAYRISKSFVLRLFKRTALKK